MSQILNLSFVGVVTVMKGGVETGFKRVKPTEYKKRLLQVVGERKNIQVKEVPMKKGNMNSDDVFIVDLGLELYQVCDDLKETSSNINNETDVKKHDCYR